MHIGVVVTDTHLKEDIVRNYVLELITNEKNECTHALARVGHSAFRFESNGCRDAATVKNRKRRAEKPLSFGDTIEWDDKDVVNRIISKLRRTTRLFESRVHEGRTQILVNGVVSSVDRFHFWSQYFPNIFIDEVSASSVLPNIAVSAWVNVTVDSNGRVCIDFDSFENVVPESSSMVAIAPWNYDNPKYTTLTVPFNEDGLIGQILLPESYTHSSKWQPEIFGREGIYTGDRLIFYKELFAYEIVIAVFKSSKECLPLATGISCEFSATWNEYEKKFIVTDYKSRGLKTPLGINGLLKASIKAVKNYPGVFKNEYFGLIDDPRGVLALLHLSPYRNSSIMVTLEDKPSMSQFRFRIVDVQPDKATKLQKWMEEAEISVRKDDGIILDNSTVYSRAHGNIFFHLPEKLRCKTSPGMHVMFSARYEFDMKRFTITDLFSVTDEVDIVSVEKRLLSGEPQNYQRAFRISATMSNTFTGFLEHDVFGLIDIGTHILRTDENSSVIVWVMRSVPDTNQMTRPARAPFVVVSVGDQEPDEIDLPQESCSQSDSTTNRAVSTSTWEVKEQPSDMVHSLQNISPVNSDLITQAAMENLKLTTEIMDSIPHLIECTDTKCAASCPTVEMIMLIVDTVPNFMEVLSVEDPPLFARCVNQIFN